MSKYLKSLSDIDYSCKQSFCCKCRAGMMSKKQKPTATELWIRWDKHPLCYIIWLSLISKALLNFLMFHFLAPNIKILNQRQHRCNAEHKLLKSSLKFLIPNYLKLSLPTTEKKGLMILTVIFFYYIILIDIYFIHFISFSIFFKRI